MPWRPRGAEALDAVEAARKQNRPGDHRHHLAHLQVVHPDDVARFAVLGAAANLQPLWACHDPQMDELTIPFLGRAEPAGSTRSATCTAPAPVSPPAATGR
jgi:predicted amidohydrolase YtcJ